MRKAASANYQNEAELLEGCALATAMKIVGGRWKPMLIGYLSHGLRRFGELRAVIPNISEKMLYQQPRELARDGLVLRAPASIALLDRTYK